jgi:hypothetical protein
MLNVPQRSLLLVPTAIVLNEQAWHFQPPSGLLLITNDVSTFLVDCRLGT